MNLVSRNILGIDDGAALVISAKSQSVEYKSKKAISKRLAKSEYSHAYIHHSLQDNLTYIYGLTDDRFTEYFFLPAAVWKKCNQASFGFVLNVGSDLVAVVYSNDELLFSQTYSSSSASDLANEINNTLGDEPILFADTDAIQILKDNGIKTENAKIIDDAWVLSIATREFRLKEASSLKESGFKVSALSLLILLGVLGIGGFYAYNKYMDAQQASEEDVVIIDPYESYKLNLNNPKPLSLFKAALKEIDMLDDLEGWQVTGVKMEGLQLDVFMSNLGNTFSSLDAVKKDNQMAITFANSEIALSKAVYPEEHMDFEGIIDSSELVLFVKDKSIEMDTLAIVEGSEDHVNWTKHKMVINVEEVDTESLTIFLSELNNLPVILTGVELTKPKLLWTGAIKLNVVGE